MQRGNLPSFQSLSDALDNDKYLTNLKSAALLGMTNQFTETRFQELQKYPHTDGMVEALHQAGLLTEANQQLVIDLLFACKTMKLRSEHKSSKSYPAIDEPAELAAFLQNMASRKLLTAKLCTVVFGDVTWQQKLRRLREILSILEPLTANKIQMILENVFGYFDLQDQLAEIDKTTTCFRFLFESVPLADHDIIRSCLQGCKARDYHSWLNVDLLMRGFRHPAMIHELFQGYHLLNKAGLLESHHKQISGNLRNSDYLAILDETDMLNPESALQVMNNEIFAEAIHALKSAQLLGIFTNFFHPPHKSGLAFFNDHDCRLILATLLDQPVSAANLVHHSKMMGEFRDQNNSISSDFELHRNLMLKLIYEMLPADKFFFTTRMAPKYKYYRDDEAIYLRVTAAILERSNPHGPQHK